MKEGKGPSSPPRILIWVTLVTLLVVVALTLQLHKKAPPPAIPIEVHGPTIGYEHATVHVVLFEEPKCVNCEKFNDLIFPKLKQEYIDTNKVKYTLVPLSFIHGSMPAAVALLCVYNENPLYPNAPLFFEYLDYMYEQKPDEHADWATLPTLLSFAKGTSPAINPKQLATCIEKETYRVRIEKNNAYARKLMGGVIGTPALYVNGIPVQDLSYSAIKGLIDHELEKEKNK